MKFRRNTFQFLKWNMPLALALSLLLLSKHSALESLILVSALQWSGIAVLLACWGVTVFQGKKVDKSFTLAIVLSAFLLVEFAFSDFETLPNFLNSLTVLLAFPVAISLGSRLEGDSFGRLVIYTSIGVVIAGAIIAPEWSVSYMGDTRESRTTLGFLRPTFLAEAGLLMIFAAGLRQGRQWHVIALALALIYISGGRTALVVAVIYMAYSAYSRLNARGRFKLLTFCALVVVMVVSYALLIIDQTDVDELNLLTSGRVYLWATEIDANLQGLQWVLGNFSAKRAFLFSEERGVSDVFGLDSFYITRLIVTGLFGLFLLLLSIIALYRRVDRPGKAIIIACIFYGLMESTAFNLTSAIAFFPLVLAAIKRSPARAPVSELGGDANPSTIVPSRSFARALWGSAERTTTTAGQAIASGQRP